MLNWQRYVEWFRVRQCYCPWRPDDRGIFHKGAVTSFLPILRLYWKGKSPEVVPPFGISTWPRVGEGYSRFFRADQILDWLAGLYVPESDPESFREALNKALDTWLVPVDAPLVNYGFLLDRRVEAVRVVLSQDDEKHGIRIRWSRLPRLFPDHLRRALVDGLDLVHTPESERAGLTRYLTVDSEVDDDGSIAGFDRANPWSPSTVCIPHKLHTAPRRLMLGASLQSRAVQLDGIEPTWPPSRDLLAAFSVSGGLTHEDAVVVSSSAAKKLTRTDVIEASVLVPAIAYWRLEVDSPGARVVSGQPLIRAWIDLYALGWRRRELEDLGWPTQGGWLEISLPAARAPEDGTLLEVVRMRNLRTPRWRELVTFRICTSVPLKVGDKLSTPHGVKGVVARILDDDAMPETSIGRAEIMISQVGITRRGALGQFAEACQVDHMNSRELPRFGRIRVLRQPQDAAPRCRVRGIGEAHDRGQRFGEMEFWALMAHGAENVASELLSLGRSTAAWVAREEHLAPAHAKTDMRALCRQALNRYFSLVGLAIRKDTVERIHKSGGAIVVRPQPNDHVVAPSRYFTDVLEVLDHLEDWNWFESSGGIVFVDLRRRPIELSIQGHQRSAGDTATGSLQLRLEAFPILPPWLRPSTATTAKRRTLSHPLTLIYRSALKAASFGWDPLTRKSLPELLRELIAVGFDRRQGAPAFLRREVLGRRLTRSARAVIIPGPELRIDEIGLPREIFDAITAGLPQECRDVVLVNRNPTLHRRGLLALRPKVLSELQNVFALPLGILGALGADFDGDQVSIVALETEAALQEAKSLLPGSPGLRLDPFRQKKPAFPLLHELSCPKEELAVASADLNQAKWCEAHSDLVVRRLREAGDGWQLVDDYLTKQAEYWEGLSLRQWQDRARLEMERIYAVREKGRRGGVLRRQLYRRKFSGWASFIDSIGALHAVTERLTQSALSVKTSTVDRPSDDGAEEESPDASATRATFSADAFFRDPVGQMSQLELLNDQSLDHQAICEALAQPEEPNGLLAWFAAPDIRTLVDIFVAQGKPPIAPQSRDPRLSWFIS